MELSIIALVSGVAGIITAWAAVIRAKGEGSKQCEEKLAAARKEAEEATAELHRIRMQHGLIIPEHGD